MRLFDRWQSIPERLGRRLPVVLKIVLLLWVLIGILIAVIPDLQSMSDELRFALGAPAAVALLFVGIGLLLKLVDAFLPGDGKISSGGDA